MPETSSQDDNTTKGFDVLKTTKKIDVVEDTSPNTSPKIDELGRSYSTGRRKNAKARVWIKRGSGKITINNKDLVEYFARPVLQMIIVQPL